jgi:hypothetical protein
MRTDPTCRASWFGPQTVNTASTLPLLEHSLALGANGFGHLRTTGAIQAKCNHAEHLAKQAWWHGFKLVRCRPHLPHHWPISVTGKVETLWRFTTLRRDCRTVPCRAGTGPACRSCRRLPLVHRQRRRCAARLCLLVTARDLCLMVTSRSRSLRPGTVKLQAAEIVMPHPFNGVGSSAALACVSGHQELLTRIEQQLWYLGAFRY